MRELLLEMRERGASDLHLASGEPPRLRLDGEIRSSARRAPLSEEEIRSVVVSLLEGEDLRRLEAGEEADVSFERPDLGRFRGHAFRRRGRVALAIRAIPRELAAIEELGLPPAVRRLAERRRGLALVTGPAGSGKSTTLAAMVAAILSSRRCHVVTVEDPVEYVHRGDRCIVSQREVGADTRSFARAVRSALRQDPDVIMVGEMRGAETMEAALTAAETGHLTLASLHTGSAAGSVDRIVDAFPAGRRTQVRGQLAGVLQGTISQLLVPAAGGGRVPATEVMVATPAVRRLVREGRTHQLESTIQAGRAHGMHTLEQSLRGLLRAGLVTEEAWLAAGLDPGTVGPDRRAEAGTEG